MFRITRSAAAICCALSMTRPGYSSESVRNRAVVDDAGHAVELHLIVVLRVGERAVDRRWVGYAAGLEDDVLDLVDSLEQVAHCIDQVVAESHSRTHPLARLTRSFLDTGDEFRVDVDTPEVVDEGHRP